MNGLNSIYFFPTKTDVQDFSKTRVAPLLSDNPFLERLMTDTDTVGVIPRRDQVRAFGGLSDCPASSSKQTHALSSRARV